MRPRGVSSALLLLVLCFFLHSGAVAARPLPAATVLPPAHQENDGLKAAADGLVLQQGATGNGDEVAELMGAAAAAEEAEACEEGNGGDDDECVQRRLLRDAHLDYIYTQHKGRP